MHLQACLIQKSGLFRTWGIVKSQSNMSDNQAYSEPWHSQNSLFKYFRRYLGIFRDIDAYSATLTSMQLRRRWDTSTASYENWKKVPWFWKEKPWLCPFRLNFPFIYNPKCFHVGPFFCCFWQNIYQSAPVPNPSVLKNFWLRTCTCTHCTLSAKCSILNLWKCSEYVTVSVTAQLFVLMTLCYVLNQTY